MLADLAGKPLGRWALEAAIGTGQPVIWIGSPQSNAIAAAQCPVAENSAPALGLSHSLAIAVRAAEARGAGALLIMLADMPLVTTGLLNRLLECGAPAACTHTDGSPGVPALLPARLFPSLAAMTGDSGAGRLMANLADLRRVSAGNRELLDVDSASDLREAAKHMERALQAGKD